MPWDSNMGDVICYSWASSRGGLIALAAKLEQAWDLLTSWKQFRQSDTVTKLKTLSQEDDIKKKEDDNGCSDTDIFIRIQQNFYSAKRIIRREIFLLPTLFNENAESQNFSTLNFWLYVVFGEQYIKI